MKSLNIFVEDDNEGGFNEDKGWLSVLEEIIIKKLRNIYL